MNKDLREIGVLWYDDDYHDDIITKGTLFGINVYSLILL